MTAAIMVFLLLVGALIQGLIPAAAWLGLSKPPILPAVALYYALVHPRGMAVTAAILAGMIQDTMSLFPVGTSALCLVVFALFVVKTRETMFRDSVLTMAVLGAAMAAFTTLGLYGMLSLNTLSVDMPLWWVALKAGGNALLGLVVAPLVWWVADTLERHVGLTTAEAR
ncbi:MAG: rod shape-determining protein MreD [bacterium]|jgi:rod shape-determining protein MreD